jgi:hypothetical protein
MTGKPSLKQSATTTCTSILNELCHYELGIVNSGNLTWSFVAHRNRLGWAQLLCHNNSTVFRGQQGTSEY